MTKTFYIASSSCPDNIPIVRDLAAKMEALGWEWAFDWTQVVEGQVNEAEFPAAAEVDIEAARSCDLFVLLRTDPLSRGAQIEVGVGLGTKQRIHIIHRMIPNYFFYHHDLVTSYETEDDFMKAFD